MNPEELSSIIKEFTGKTFEESIIEYALNLNTEEKMVPADENVAVDRKTERLQMLKKSREEILGDDTELPADEYFDRVLNWVDERLRPLGGELSTDQRLYLKFALTCSLLTATSIMGKQDDDVIDLNG